MDYLGNFSMLLKQLRESKGLTQSELADKLGVSRGSISFYENRDRIPDIAFLYKMSEFFDVSCDYLLGLASNSSKSIEDQAISEATGLSGLSISILRQAHSSRLADILNLLIEQEFAVVQASADTLEKYPSLFSKYRTSVLKDLKKEMQVVAQKEAPHWPKQSDVAMQDEIRYVAKERLVRNWAFKHYKPILTRLHLYLICWKKNWIDDPGELLYFMENGEIKKEEDPLTEYMKNRSLKSEDMPSYVPLPQNKTIDSALLLEIQDAIRELKFVLSEDAREILHQIDQKTAPGADNTRDGYRGQ